MYGPWAASGLLDYQQPTGSGGAGPTTEFRALRQPLPLPLEPHHQILAATPYPHHCPRHCTQYCQTHQSFHWLQALTLI